VDLENLKKELKNKSSAKRAKNSQRFFKTGPGEYGEGDVFLGITVPEIRKIANKFFRLKLQDIEELLKSKFHEERLVSLLILVVKFKKGDENARKKIYEFYLKNLEFVNNWDLVDSSAEQVIGDYLLKRNKNILARLAKSKNLWERRIAIVATFRFIKNNKFFDTFKISKILLRDEHDLIHKAVGWMLREVGNRSLESEEEFLKKHYKKMPRTMLRYAIEKFNENKRLLYLKGKI